MYQCFDVGQHIQGNWCGKLELKLRLGLYLVEKSDTIEKFSQFDKRLYVGCVVYWFMNGFVHQNVKYFVQKIKNMQL